MSVLRYLGATAIAAAIGFPSLARAADLAPMPDSLTLTPTPVVSQSISQDQQQGSVSPQYLDEPATAPAPAPEAAPAAPAPPAGPNLHGFFDMPFKTAYITPRGLVVENKGLVMEPVFGLVFPLDDIGPVSKVAFITGIWNSINTAQDDHFVGPWNELDYFASLSGSVGNFTGTLTYSPWFSPPHNFTIESTSDFKVSYDDTGMFLKDFALKPYVDFFYSISGDSTVILGRHGSTYYFEPGVNPSYTYKGIEDWPITFSNQTYFSVGPKNFWNSAETGSHFGVFSTSLSASVPLPIPIKYGAWHAGVSIQYYYLLNHFLEESGTLACGNDTRSNFNGSVDIGFNF